MRKPFFNKTTIQMLVMSFFGLVIIVWMSFSIGESMKTIRRDTASVKSR